MSNGSVKSEAGGELGARIEENLGLVHREAGRLMRSAGPEVEYDDLVGAGTVGLIQAVRGFDPDRGLAFSTFAAPRVRGAILDELRRMDEAPRSHRRRRRQMKRAAEELRAALDREPTERELAAALDIEPEELWRWKVRETRSTPVGIGESGAEDGDEVPESTIGADDDLPDEIVHKRELAGVLAREIERLPERERHVLVLYYFEDLKMAEIAKVLSVTESRISQIRSSALARLREGMDVLAPSEVDR